MTTCKFGLVLAALTLVQAETLQKNDPQPALEITCTPNPDDCTIISVTIANKDREIELHTAKLPWSHWHSITLVLVKKDGLGGTIIPLREYIDDPLFGTTKLAKGESKRGQIDLKERFPGLGDAIRKGDVDMFWSYETKTVGGKTVPAVGGWLLLSGKKKS